MMILFFILKMFLIMVATCIIVQNVGGNLDVNVICIKEKKLQNFIALHGIDLAAVNLQLNTLLTLPLPLCMYNFLCIFANVQLLQPAGSDGFYELLTLFL